MAGFPSQLVVSVTAKLLKLGAVLSVLPRYRSFDKVAFRGEES